MKTLGKYFLISILFFGSLIRGQADQKLDQAWEVFDKNMDSAIALIHQAYDESRASNDMISMGRALSYRAIFYDIEGKPDSSLFLFYRALEIQEPLNDTVGLIKTYNNLGIFFHNQWQLEKSIKYYNKAYDKAMLMDDYGSAGGSLINMGIIEGYRKNTKNALAYYNEAERLYILEGDTNALSDVWSNKATIYHDLGQYQKAFGILQKSLAINEIHKTGHKLITERILATNILVAMGQYALAEKYGLEAIRYANEFKIPERMQYAYDATSTVYYHMGDYKKAYDFNNRYRDIRDSLINENMGSIIAQMEAENNIQKTQNENTKLKLEAEHLDNIRLKKQKNENRLYFIIAVSVTVLIALSVLLILGRKNLRLEKANTNLMAERKKQAEQLLDKEKILMKESHHRIKNNLQLINSILELQSRSIKDPNIKQIFDDSKGRIDAISFAHHRLYNKETIESINLKGFLQDLVTSIKSSSIPEDRNIEIRLQLDEITTTTETAIPLGLIANELLINAIKYAFPNNTNGKITLALINDISSLTLSIEDDGVGMEEHKNNTGFGSKLIKSMVRQLKAEYSLSLTTGVQHLIKVPLNQQKT